MKSKLGALAFPIASLAGCAPSQEVALRFDARIGAQPFVCGQSYSGVGSTGTSLTMTDLRFYVHDVRLVDTSGTEHPLVLDSSDFQGQGIALLDFETGGSGCEFGDAEVHTAITGTVGSMGPFNELRLRVGVPQSRNFLDIATARAPLNRDTMYWGWLGGYK